MPKRMEVGMVFRRAVNKRSFRVALEVPLGFRKVLEEHKFEDSEAGGRGRVPAVRCLRPRCWRSHAGNSRGPLSHPPFPSTDSRVTASRPTASLSAEVEKPASVIYSHALSCHSSGS